MPYRATARSINSPHKNMKNTLSIILLLCGIAQANAAYVVGDADFSLEDATAMVSGGSFAVSFDFGDQTLYEVATDNKGLDFNLTIGTGNGVPEADRKSYRIDIRCMSMPDYGFNSLGLTSTDYTVNPDSSTIPEVKGPFIIQYLAATDNTNAQVTLSYVNNDSLQEIASVTLSDNHTLPSTIGFAEIKVTNAFEMSVDTDITTWTGVVTAEDIKNPQPAPSPAVPEPTTATLSLLAVAAVDKPPQTLQHSHRELPAPSGSSLYIIQQPPSRHSPKSRLPRGK